MANINGIIFSDIFIENKDFFIDFFENIYKQNFNLMQPAIIQLQSVLNEYTLKTVNQEMSTKFNEAWNNFEKYILFNNQDLQLIVAYRGDSSGLSAEFSKIVKQSDVMQQRKTKYGNQYGIDSAHNLIDDSMKAISASKVENFLRMHLNGFLTQLEEKIDSDTAYVLHEWHEYCLNSAYQNVVEPHLTGARWREAFFGNMSSKSDSGVTKSYYYSGQGLGIAYDAFMNHMANKETGIYNYLSSGGLSASWADEINFSKRDVSVYEEEGGIGPGGNYPLLLKNATNSTGWYTGGDIVIVNPNTHQVVYNIQLKTTTRGTQSIFGEKVQKIREFINQFDMNNFNVRDFANKLFEFLLTSVSNNDNFNSLPEKEVEKLLETSLSSKNISVNLFK